MTAPTPYVPEDGAIICLPSEVPDEGWEYCVYPGGRWYQAPPPSDSVRWLVVARPIPLEPVTITIPRDLAENFARTGWIHNTAARDMSELIEAALDVEADQ